MENGKLVLVVDDAEDFRRFLSIILERAGYEIIGVANGLEALNYLSEPKHTLPALILLDLQMPVMTGREFLAQQIENPSFAEIPVIICSSEYGISKSKFRNTSVVACFPKITEPEELVSAIDLAVSQKQPREPEQSFAYL